MKIFIMILISPAILVLDIIPALLGFRNFVEYSDDIGMSDGEISDTYYFVTGVILLLILIIRS